MVEVSAGRKEQMVLLSTPTSFLPVMIFQSTIQLKWMIVIPIEGGGSGRGREGIVSPGVKFVWECRDIQQNDTCHIDAQHNDTQHSDTQHTDTQHSNTQHSDTQNNDIQHYNTQHNDAQHYDTKHHDTQYHDNQHNILI
jgi:hypothetical protein